MKQPNKPLLTIGIPVYNGGKFIREAIKHILEQLDTNNRDKIEIVVSDNASIDGTGIIVQELKKQYSQVIHYFLNEKNVGFDNNVELIIKRSKAKYIWLLGCGETLLPEALNRILEQLALNTYDNIFLNFKIFSEQFNDIEEEEAVKITKNIVLCSPEEVIKNLPEFSTALSANIVNKKAWLEISHIKLVEKGWIHLERIMHILFRNNYQGSLYLKDKFFVLYREIDGWWTKPISYINYLAYNVILLKMAEKYKSKELYSSLSNNKYKSLVYFISQSKKAGLVFDRKLIEKSKKIFGERKIIWSYSKLVMKLPSFLFSNKIGMKLILIIGNIIAQI